MSKAGEKRDKMLFVANAVQMESIYQSKNILYYAKYCSFLVLKVIYWTKDDTNQSNSIEIEIKLVY